MKRLPFLLVLGSVAGCGYDYDTFADEFSDAMCNKYDECDYFTEYWTYDMCMGTDAEDTGGTEWLCEDYDSALAQECVDGWVALTCDDLAAASTPDACTTVCSNY